MSLNLQIRLLKRNSQRMRPLFRPRLRLDETTLPLLVSFPKYGQNGGKITDDNFKCNFNNKDWLLSIMCLLESVSWELLDKKSPLVYIMARRGKAIIIWTNDDPVQERICAALAGDDNISATSPIV